MARLIDADALLERMMKDPLFPLVERYGVSGVINAEPTVDTVEVVRCKDCEYGEQDEVERWVCRSLGCQIGNEDGSGYCADAERRIDERPYQQTGGD